MLPLLLAVVFLQDPQTPPAPSTKVEDIQAVARVLGLELSDTELKLMPRTLDEQRAGYAAVREVPLANSDSLCFAFDPLLPGMKVRECKITPALRPLPRHERPAKIEELAYADIPTLASLLR